MNVSEVYANPPVVLATVEVRHTESSTLGELERRQVKEVLRRWTPIQRSSKQLSVTLLGVASSGDQSVEEFPKYFSRDSMTAVSFRREAVVIEVTRYDGWLKLKELITAALEARELIGSPDAAERVGLRYINEVRPLQELPVDWGLWVDHSLLGPTQLSDVTGLEASAWQGVCVYGPREGRTLALRYGPGDGQAVELGMELIRARPGAGPFMWLDIDSFWAHSGELPAFDVPMLLDRCEELHKPIREVFERLITSKLRDEVLRRG